MFKLLAKKNIFILREKNFLKVLHNIYKDSETLPLKNFHHFTPSLKNSLQTKRLTLKQFYNSRAIPKTIQT